MDRTAALAYLGADYAETLAALGLTANEATFGASLDRALRDLGYSGDLSAVDTSDAETGTYLALLDAYGLGRMLRAAASMVDVTVGATGTSKRYSQLRDALAAELAAATAVVDGLGLSTRTGGWSQGSIGLDFIEPVSTGA